MKAPMAQSRLSLSDALYALSVEQAVPDPELLDECIRRCPEHASTLTEFAIDLVLDSLVTSDSSAPQATSPASRAVMRAMSHFQNRLHAVRQTGTRVQETAPPNPFAALERVAFRQLAERLNVNTVFLMKLRDRQIAVETMTAGFQHRIAQELNVPVDLLVAHFSAPPTIQRSVRFSADRKPEVGHTQTFQEAVRSSGLFVEQQRHLLSL